MEARFWGVRGSTPTPQIENLAYGGNTPCIELRTGSGQVLILDGGTGIRHLGQSLGEEFRQRDLTVDIFLTHYHWDHIQGIPYFMPLYRSGNEINFFAAAGLGRLRERLEGQMCQPYFPVRLDAAAPRKFAEIDGPVVRGELTVHPFPLNHPQGAYGYRVEGDGGVVVYASDFEHGNPRLDRVLRDFAASADLLIFDAQYTPEEYGQFRGWGHSTWLEATRVARDAGVERLVLFHHDPGHDDDAMRRIGEAARAAFEETLVAVEKSCVRCAGLDRIVPRRPAGL